MNSMHKLLLDGVEYDIAPIDVDLSELTVAGRAKLYSKWIVSNGSISFYVAPNGSATYSIASLLPSDSNTYEVMLHFDNNGGRPIYSIYTDISSDIYICWDLKAEWNSRTIVVPVGTGRTIAFSNKGGNSLSGNIVVLAYRRMGTNT